MNSIIKRLARKFSLDLRRYVPMRERPFNVIDLVIERYIRTEVAFSFLQIGAFDGQCGDPIHAAVIKYDLSGILVEPNPYAYDKLIQTYSGRSGLIFENSAIAWKDGLSTLYRFKPGSHLPPWTQQVSSFNLKHLRAEARGIRNAANLIEALSVPTVSIETLKRKYSIESIGLLQVDTEGFDFDIIQMTLAARLYPKVVNYEHVHLSRLDQHACRQLLAASGYRYITVGKDTLAVRDEATSSVPDGAICFQHSSLS